MGYILKKFYDTEKLDAKLFGRVILEGSEAPPNQYESEEQSGEVKALVEAMMQTIHRICDESLP